MKFGFCLPNYEGKIRPEEMVGSAVLAEGLGFDSVWATDHLIVPRKFNAPYGYLTESLVTLSFIAAKTETVELGTSILVLPQRNPILVAKQAAALDMFSRGRMILGAGAGWLEEEFQYLNADFAKRGKILDESIALMRSLWKDENVSFSGKFFRLKDAVSFPKPTRQIPIWIGGGSMAAIRRASRIGDGWHPVGLTPAQLERGGRVIRRGGRKVTISLRLSARLGGGRSTYRSPSGERRTGLVGSREDVAKSIEAYRDAGLEYLIVFLSAPNSEQLREAIKNFASEILRSFK